MKSPVILRRPAQDVNHPFVQRIPPISHLVATLVIRLLQYCSSCVQVTLILLNNGPKAQDVVMLAIWLWQREATKFFL